MAFHVVIPARYGSVRLPGKPLLAVAGKPLVQHVYERAVESRAESITIATDDRRILEACRGFGAQTVMTAETPQSGTDRIAEVAAKMNWPAEAIVVNLQGDEPLMPPKLVTQAARTLASDDAAGIATLATPISSRAEFENANAVKVVLDWQGRALYFSRAPIPCTRDGAGASNTRPFGLRHVGLYAYRIPTVGQLARTPPCALERAERLEQLRALWLGIGIAVETVGAAPPAGVDTVDDLKRVEEFL
jgi:3-deoxy-manno-octulosonate cytidylyltransferase (CMP-KDO synthetase)